MGDNSEENVVVQWVFLCMFIATNSTIYAIMEDTWTIYAVIGDTATIAQRIGLFFRIFFRIGPPFCAEFSEHSIVCEYGSPDSQRERQG